MRKSIAEYQRPIAILLLVIHLNFVLLAGTLYAMCSIMDLNPAGHYFLQMAGLAAMTAMWLAYRLRKVDEPLRYDFAQTLYPAGMVLSFALALVFTVLFDQSAETSRWIDLVILSNGLFIVLCLAIKLNDAHYSLE